MPARRADREGFSLIELLVALAVFSLAAVALLDIKCHLGAIRYRAVAFPGNAREMDKHILSTRLRGDETKALFFVEELYCAVHFLLLIVWRR